MGRFFTFSSKFTLSARTSRLGDSNIEPMYVRNILKSCHSKNTNE